MFDDLHAASDSLNAWTPGTPSQPKHWLNALGLREPNVMLAIAMLSGIASTVAISTLLHRYIEQPCIDFGHWLGKFLRF